ncbi:hypothetical protein [Candidatus Poriferisodalis sp.]|uniref:hypothetical protein n=1 Tax=Candidatus Poriferisodalis sp. TaxID=3101277 RepID=UPI003B5CB0B1
MIDPTELVAVARNMLEPSGGNPSEAAVRRSMSTAPKAPVRLKTEDQQLLERLAPEFGGKTATVREALQRFAADHDRKEAFDAFLKAWDEEDGPLSDEEISAVARRCGL